jgi:hypothetical protein
MQWEARFRFLRPNKCEWVEADSSGVNRLPRPSAWCPARTDIISVIALTSGAAPRCGEQDRSLSSFSETTVKDLFGNSSRILIHAIGN